MLLRVTSISCSVKDMGLMERMWWAGQALPGPPGLPPAGMPMPSGVPAPAGAPVHMAPSVEPAAATPYLEVNGMVTPEVLMDDEEYKEV